MIGGDISNEAPKTVMVNIDCLVDTDTEIVRKGWFKKEERVKRVLNLRLANLFFRQSRNLDVKFECFSCDGSSLREFEDRLERLNINPFQYFTVYKSVDAVVKEMPYRPNLVGIIDIPERALRYGSRYMDQSRLTAL